MFNDDLFVVYAEEESIYVLLVCRYSLSWSCYLCVDSVYIFILKFKSQIRISLGGWFVCKSQKQWHPQSFP